MFWQAASRMRERTERKTEKVNISKRPNIWGNRVRGRQCSCGRGRLTSESRAMMGYESNMAIVSTTREALSIECVRKALVAYAAYVEVEYLLKTSTRVKRYNLLSSQSLDPGVITMLELTQQRLP
jgi:hypothetical protein